MDKIITVRVPEDLDNSLRKISREEDKPVSNLIRESLRRYIQIYRFRKLREKVLPFAEAQGLLTDEDIFNKL